VSGLVHRFDPPTRCVVGTVGQPGERTFFLQVQDADRIISVILEKDHILDQGAPDVVAPSPIDDAPLAQPILTDFRIGILGLAWDDVENRIVIEAGSRVVELEEIGDLPELEIEDEDANNEMLDIRLTVELARGFVERSLRVVKAGRPPCPFCGNLLDPTGHICPRANGYRR
jgi:uncharacterized repeat protein (TIGR03847 family)